MDEIDLAYEAATLRQFEREKLAAVKKDIARRLRRLCPHFSDEEFERLVQSMAEKQIRHESRIAKWGRSAPGPGAPGD